MHAVDRDAQLVDVVAERHRRDGDRQHEREQPGERAEAVAHAAHEPHPARAGEHADERRGQRDVAQVAGEAGLRHRGHGDHERGGDEPERDRHPTVAAPPPRGQRGDPADHRPGEDGRREQRARALEDLEERRGRERRGVGVGVARTARGPQRLARAPPLREDPERDERGEARADDQAPARVLPREPEPVEPPERPHLGAQQRGGEAEQEGVEPAAVEVALDGPQADRDEDALRVAAREVADVLVGEHERAGRDDARHRAREPRGQPVGHRERQQPAGAGDHEPQVGRRRVAEQREGGREEDRQRLPGRAAHRVEVEVGHLAPPDDPGPRVVGRLARPQQGQRGQAEADEHEQLPRPRRRLVRAQAVAAAGAGEPWDRRRRGPDGRGHRGRGYPRGRSTPPRGVATPAARGYAGRSSRMIRTPPATVRSLTRRNPRAW